MVLKPDDFTEQAQEIIGKSQEIVRDYRHSQWDVEHILIAILDQEKGVPADILHQLNVDVSGMRERLDQLLSYAPTVAYESTQIYVAPRAARALDRAKQEAEPSMMILLVPNTSSLE